MRFKASSVVAVAATVIAAVALLPGIGFGEASTSHGGTPTDVYSTQDPGVCHADEISTGDPTVILPTQVDISATSNVTVYFASMWSGFERDSKLVRKVEIVGDGFYENSPDFGVSPGQVHDSGAMMWTFENIAPGAYTVQATIAIYPEAGAFISHYNNEAVQSCALSVLVAPVVNA